MKVEVREVLKGGEIKETVRGSKGRDLMAREE